MAKKKNRTIVFDTLTIPKSSNDPATIMSLLTTLDKNQKASIQGVEVRGHGAAFYFGTRAGQAWTNKDSQQANLPYYRECGNDHLDLTWLGAVADADITGVVIEVEFGAY